MINDNFNIPKFKKGEIVYYLPDKNNKKSSISLIGLDSNGRASTNIKNSKVKEDTPYEVVECKPPSQAWLCLSIKLEDGRTPFFDAENFISEKEYKNIKGIKDDNEKEEITKGSLVYFIGNYKSALKKDKPYKVIFVYRHMIEVEGFEGQFFTKTNFALKKEEKIKFKPGDIIYYKGDKETYSSNLNKNEPYEIDFVGPNILMVKGKNGFYRHDLFISEEEYKKSKTKHNFKVGDVVYYNGIKREYDYHKPYKLFSYSSPKDNLFGIYSDRGDGLSLEPIEKEVVNRDFIDENEYRKKYGVSPPKIVANYNDFVKNFKVGDIVYYMGDKIKRLKGDTPYKVELFNPVSNTIKIEEIVCSAEDFISEKDYDKLNIDEDSDQKIGEKSETKIKLQIYKDTKNNTLVWIKPYSTHNEWFRSTLKLKKPEGAYLRFDLRKKDDKWELVIYFHKNRPPFKSEDNSVVIKHYKESQILCATARRVKEQIEEGIKIQDILPDDEDKNDYMAIYDDNENPF